MTRYRATYRLRTWHAVFEAFNNIKIDQTHDKRHLVNKIIIADLKLIQGYASIKYSDGLTKLKAADVVQKDIIVSNLFLKLHFDHQKMTHYSLKEPFASLVALNEFQSGGGGWT